VQNAAFQAPENFRFDDVKPHISREKRLFSGVT
jgi:hypothetical protein